MYTLHDGEDPNPVITTQCNTSISVTAGGFVLTLRWKIIFGQTVLLVMKLSPELRAAHYLHAVIRQWKASCAQ